MAILTHWTRIGSYVAMLWLLSIAVNLISTGMFFDLALRHAEIALAAFTLAPYRSSPGGCQRAGADAG